MSEINFIITKKEDLKSLLYEWLYEHPNLQIKKEEQVPNKEKPINRNELAEYLGISPVTVTDWMKKGLPYRRMHGRVFFMKEEVLSTMSSFNHRKNTFIKKDTPFN